MAGNEEAGGAFTALYFSIEIALIRYTVYAVRYMLPQMFFKWFEKHMLQIPSPRTKGFAFFLI